MTGFAKAVMGEMASLRWKGPTEEQRRNIFQVPGMSFPIDKEVLM